MATSVLCPASSLSPELSVSSIGLSKSSFLPGVDKLVFAPSANSRRNPLRRCFRSPSAKKLDHIPKQFREENLKDGLMDNYKNVPSSLYGLSASQMSMFMTDNNPASRQAENLDEEKITSAWNYSNESGVNLLSAPGNVYSKYSMRSSSGGYSMRSSGGGEYTEGRRNPPPDLPSLLLDARIIYLGMPVVPAVTELIVAQFIYLDFTSRKKPIYLYINSTGTHDDRNQIVASENDAYAIADAMSWTKAPVCTVNVGMAFGQAAMLLSRGKKGYRALQPNSFVRLYLPSIYKSSGSSTDMWVKAKELEASTKTFLELLSGGVGKSEEELIRDLQLPKYFMGQSAIDYGIADRIVQPKEKPQADRSNYENYATPTQRAAAKKLARGGYQATPSSI